MTSANCVWSFTVCTRKDMVIQSPLISTDMTRRTTTAVKLVEPLFRKGLLFGSVTLTFTQVLLNSKRLTVQGL